MKTGLRELLTKPIAKKEIMRARDEADNNQKTDTDVTSETENQTKNETKSMKKLWKYLSR